MGEPLKAIISSILWNKFGELFTIIHKIWFFLNFFILSTQMKCRYAYKRTVQKYNLQSCNTEVKMTTTIASPNRNWTLPPPLKKTHRIGTNQGGASWGGRGALPPRWLRHWWHKLFCTKLLPGSTQIHSTIFLAQVNHHTCTYPCTLDCKPCAITLITVHLKSPIEAYKTKIEIILSMLIVKLLIASFILLS